MDWQEYIDKTPSWDYGSQYAGQIGKAYADAYGGLSKSMEDQLSSESKAKWADLVAYVKDNIPQLKATMNDTTAKNAAELETAGQYEDAKRSALESREANAVKRGMSGQYSEAAAAAGIIGNIELQKARQTAARALSLRKEDAANNLNMFGAKLGAYQSGVNNRLGQFDRYASADAQVLANMRQDAMNAYNQAIAAEQNKTDSEGRPNGNIGSVSRPNLSGIKIGY